MQDPARSLAHRLPFYYGWIVVAVALVTLGMGYTARAIFSLLYTPILDEFGWDRGLTAAIFSVGFVSAIVYAPLIGFSIERFGPQIVMPIATILVATGFVLATVATEPWHFMVNVGVLVVGMTTLLAFNGPFIFVPKWFEANRALALGIMSSGVGVFGVIVLPAFQWMIDAYDWRTACLVYAAMLVVVIVPLTAVLQRRAPEDLGLLPDGRPHEHVPNTASTTKPQVRLIVVDQKWAAVEWTLARAIRTLRFWLVATAFFTSLFAWYALVVHQTQYLRDTGFDATTAAFALGLVPVFGIAGQICLGWLGDRIYREWVWMLSMAGFAVAALLLLALELWPADAPITIEKQILMYAMVAVQGFFGFALPAVYGAVAADIFQGKNYGIIFGTLTISGSLGGAAGPWAFGWLHDLTASYQSALWLEIGMAVLSCIVIWVASPRSVRRVARD